MRYERTAIASGLCLAVAAAYSGVLACQFVAYDDDMYVTGNPLVAGGLEPRAVLAALTAFHAGNWHPVTWISHMLDVSLFGLAPAGHHAMSVALHAANAVLVYLVLESLTGARWRSAFAAALFALHPLRVESVAWVAERKDVLSTCFGLAALGAWVAYARSRRRSRYWTALALFALSLASKPMLVTFPFLLLVLDGWPLRRLDSARALWPLVREKLPFLALAAASCVVTLFAQQVAITPVPLRLRLENSLVAYAEYLRLVVDPRALSALYPYRLEFSWGELAGAAALLAGLSALALLEKRRRPWLLVGWLWFAGTLVPTLGVGVQVGRQAFADRYTYFPFIGLALALSWTWAELAGRVRQGRAIAAVAAALALAACVAQTREQVTVWRDTVSLFEHALAVTEGNWYVHAELGIMLAQRGELERARTELEAALRIRPEYPRALANLGLVAAESGAPTEGIEYLERALALEPKLLGARLAYAIALERLDRFADAEAQYQLALDDTRSAREARLRLARLLSVLPDDRLRDGGRAVALCDEACRAAPCDSPEALDVCAMASMEAARGADAVAMARRAVGLARARGDSVLAAKIEGRLAAYLRGEPTRLRTSDRSAVSAPDR